MLVPECESASTKYHTGTHCQLEGVPKLPNTLAGSTEHSEETRPMLIQLYHAYSESHDRGLSGHVIQEATLIGYFREIVAANYLKEIEKKKKCASFHRGKHMYPNVNTF